MKVKKCKGHTSFVNSCCPARRGPELLVSGSDDGSIKVSELPMYFIILWKFPLLKVEYKIINKLSLKIILYDL